jgi:hypothetical protein
MPTLKMYVFSWGRSFGLMDGSVGDVAVSKPWLIPFAE